MLRISESRDATTTVLRVEGKLRDRGVTALDACCRAAFERQDRLVLELCEVSYVDLAAIALLRGLRREGVELRDCPPLLAHFLEEAR